MIAYRNGRRRVVHPGARDARRMKLALSAMILLLLAAMSYLCAGLGLHESILAIAVPAYRITSVCGTHIEPAAEEHAVVQTLSLTDIEPLYASAQVLAGANTDTASNTGPTILIYHTHTTEAYLQSDDSQYIESGKWRTKDQSKSVVAVGALLTQTLRQEYGLSVLHDTTNHEPPKLSTAYSRSLETMLAYQREYPSLRVFIDVHRDAYATQTATDGEPRDYIELEGRQIARIMFVVGTGKGATGSGFAELPDFEDNYAFAEQITTRLNQIDAQFAREIRIKTGRYNQHVTNCCMLVEVGHNANTLEQALNAVPYLADAIAASLAVESVQTVSVSGNHIWLPETAVKSD